MNVTQTKPKPCPAILPPGNCQVVVGPIGNTVTIYDRDQGIKLPGFDAWMDRMFRAGIYYR